VLPIFILLIQTIWAQIPSYVPVYGLLSYYPFNGNGNDLSPFNNHLINHGATLTSDRFGNSNAAYDFDGLSSYLTRANPSYTFNANSTFSVSFWYKRMNTANLGIPIMHATTASGNFVWIFQLASVNMQYGTNKQGSSWIWAPSTTTTDIWTHIVLIYDAGQMKLFKDNILVASSTFTHTGVSSTTLPLLVGKGVGGSHFYGQIDDIGIWNRTLSTCEINDLFHGSNSLSTLNAGSDQYACNGSQVTLSATGAGSYLWSPNIVNGSTFSPTISQNYTVTGFDANGCSAWDQVAVISQNVNVNAGQDLHLCTGDSAILNATGYPGIQWSGGISNNTPFLPIQTQYFIASASNSNGCSDADTVTVFVNSLPQLNAGPDQQICFGEEAILSGTGGIFMYWNNGVADSIPFIPFTTTTYILTGASPEGCLSTDTLTVFVNEATSSTLNISAIDSYTLNGQTYTTSGSYTQVLTNAAGCDSLLTINLTLDFTGLEENVNVNWKLYPNPASDYTTLAIKEALMGSAIVLYDAFGREMLKSTVYSQETIIDLHHIPTGLYFVQVGSEIQRLEVVR
jgi:hypothetical protein